jgi:hypothetical protein
MNTKLLILSAVLMAAVYSGCGNDKDVSDLIVAGDVYKHTSGGVVITVRDAIFPVSGLDIRINGHALGELPEKGSYQISGNVLPIEPGVDYNLEFVYGGHRVTSTTVLPDESFEIISPQEDYEHDAGTDLEAIWGRSDDNAAYVLLVEEIYPEITVPRHLTGVMADTSYVIPASAFDDYGSYAIIVFAVHDGIIRSENIVYQINSNVEPDVAGFFGAYIEKTVLIYVR